MLERGIGKADSIRLWKRHKEARPVPHETHRARRCYKSGMRRHHALTFSESLKHESCNDEAIHIVHFDAARDEHATGSGSMNALLVRVGVDQSDGGGNWNGPVNSTSREYAYVAIPESKAVHPGMDRPYATLIPTLGRFGVTLPQHLVHKHMHLDPDFEHLTYGDQGERAKQLSTLQEGDRIVFYAGLRDINTEQLVYALIGLLVIERWIFTGDVRLADRAKNAHSRRENSGFTDMIWYGRAEVSGRLRRCLPIGEYRNRAYRVTCDLLSAWGGLSVEDGYLQRSVRLPRFLDPSRFLDWLETQGPELIQANN